MEQDEISAWWEITGELCKRAGVMAKDEKIMGLQKAAILLIALGPERSALIFKHLKEEEIEELTLEIANTRSVTPQLKEEVIEEFYQVCLAQQYIAEGGIGYAKELLEKALGSDRAMDVISKLTASLQVKPFEFVRKTDPSQLLNFIQDEHPQTIALIMSYLSPAQSSLIISSLPPERQADVAKRIAVMDRTSPDIIKEVEKVLESKLSTLVNQDFAVIGGVDAVVEILNTTTTKGNLGRARYWCGPWNRKAYYGNFGNRRAGIGGRNQEEDVRIRRYSAA